MTEYKIGQIFYADEDIEINKGRTQITITVKNVGDRPIQVGSHYHFFEVNRFLKFEREKAYGMRLDIPSGTAVRFEPGEEKQVILTEFGGNKAAIGFNGLTMGDLSDDMIKQDALKRAEQSGFI